MKVGLSILLMAVGVVLVLAVQGDIDGVSLPLIGHVLIGAGLLGLVLTLLLSSRSAKRTTQVTNSTNRQKSQPDSSTSVSGGASSGAGEGERR